MVREGQHPKENGKLVITKRTSASDKNILFIGTVGDVIAISKTRISPAYKITVGKNRKQFDYGDD